MLFIFGLFVGIVLGLWIDTERGASSSRKPGCTCTLGGGWDTVGTCVVHMLPPSDPRFRRVTPEELKRIGSGLVH